ncbi:MAG: linear amide C-N hydrolase [Clostridia bacterium]|nr:linear amide C-N hydrolase [Clostridia bacterium]
MCTAMHAHGCFGRTLDLECTYAEQVVICPRDFPLRWRHLSAPERHYAIIGMATVAEGYPLYYDGMNEHGLAMAGLRFSHSGAYTAAQEGDVASFELIPYVLGRCATLDEARAALVGVRVCDTAFSAALPPSKLHWMVSDGKAALVVESTAEGVRVYDDPVGVLTNEPPFPIQLAEWEKHTHLTADEPQETPPHLGRGSGSLGLPGDFSSPSRFVRAAFIAAHSEADNDPVGQFFHAMAAVEVPRGCLRLPDGRRVVSHYTACMDLVAGTYYYRTYGCHRIQTVRLTDPEGDALAAYPLPTCDNLAREN